MGMMLRRRSRVSEVKEFNADELTQMTVKQLTKYAAINGIDLGNARKKEDIINLVYSATDIK